MAGHSINADDAQVGAVPTAIVSDAFWKAHFGSSEDLSNAKFFAAGRWIQVVGVLPAKVTFPAHAGVYLPHPDQRLFIGTSRAGDWSPDDFSRGGERVIARMRPGVTVDQANGMEKALLEQMRKANTDPHHGFGDVGVRRLVDTMTFRVKDQITTITIAGIFVALVGLFSLFFMSAARAAELRKDIAIRIALGAERMHLFRREISLWFLAGVSASAAVIGCTALAIQDARNMKAVEIPRLEDLGLSFSQALWIVLGTMAVALLLAIPYSLACREAEPVSPILNQGESRSRLVVKPAVGNVVSVAQLSLALALAAMAVTVGVNYWRLATTAPGINPSGVFVANSDWASASSLGNQASLTSNKEQNSGGGQDTADTQAANPSNSPLSKLSGSSEASSGNGLFSTALKTEKRDSNIANYLAEQEVSRAASEISRQPGVISAGFGDVPYEPWSGGGQYIRVNGKESDATPDMYAFKSDMPKILGMRVLQGRWFDRADKGNEARVAVVGETFSRKYFAGNAIGKQVLVEQYNQLTTIVGVVDDVVANYGQGIKPTMYFPIADRIPGGTPPPLVAKMAPGVTRPPFPVPNEPGGLVRFQPWTSMEKMMSDAGATDRASATVAAWFAILVLLLSAAGAYAVFWMITIQRQREMAIRICFGALPVKVALGLVLNAVVLACCAGVGGFAIQQAMQRVLSSRIYQFPAFSWTTFLVSFGVITVATLLSVARPAMSVLRISPAELLRDN